MIDEFDYIIGMYLLHYLNDIKTIQKVCNNIYKNLKVGGKVITYMLNPSLSREPKYYDKYGFSPNIEGVLTNGSPYSFNLFQVKQSYHVFFWKKELIEDIFRNAGFKKIKWISPKASEKAKNKFGEKYWKALEENPWCIYFLASK